jgi:hypothetical protein
MDLLRLRPHTPSVKPAIRAACENRFASRAGAQSIGLFGSLVLICVGWSTLRTLLDANTLVVVAVVAALAVVFGIVFHLVNGPGVVVAGDDGVALRWPRHSRFVAYADIERVVTDGPRISIRLRTGEIVPVRLRGLPKDGGARDTKLVERIERRSSREDRAKRLTEATDFARGAESAREWLEAIAARVRSKGAYRGAALEREMLVRIVKSGRAEPTARAACAWILRATGFESGEDEIVRRAAAATAHASLEAALGAIADPATEREELEARMALVPASA